MTASKKRRFGQIDKQRSGRFRARYTAPDGLLYKADRTFEYRDDAIAWLRKEEILIELDNWTPPTSRTPEAKSLTVGQWLAEWLELRKNGADKLKPSTLIDYENTLNRRILEVPGSAAFLRDIRLSQLNKKDVLRWWDAINAQFDSPPYNRNAYARLKTALNAAVERELISVNPCTVQAAKTRVKPARKELPEAKVMGAIVDAMSATNSQSDGRARLVAVLTLFHGLRIGEALALTRKDIVDTGYQIIVRIRRNAHRVPGEGMKIMDTPKTDAGWRDVPIFPRFNEHVRWHLETFSDEYLFTTAAGKLMMDTSYRSIMDRAKIRAGYEGMKITPHYGRVWLITTLSEAGMPIPEIGRILGQVDLRTITEVYMRSSSQHRNTVLGNVNDMLENKKSPSGNEGERKRAR